MYTFQNHRSGDTFAGVKFTLANQLGAINLTGAVIEVIFNNGESIAQFLNRRGLRFFSSTANEIAVTDAAGGAFEIREQVVDWEPRTYTGVLRVRFAGGKIKTYANITWTIV
jgi:hypothetical protein